MTLLTVTLNTCVDKTYLIPHFTLGLIHRPLQAMVTAGGKGINVARAYQALGGDVIAAGYSGGTAGHLLRTILDSEQIAHRFVLLSGESRTCIAIHDPDTGSQTEINELGPSVDLSDETRLLSLIRELLPVCETVVISGSLPPGASPDICSAIIHLVQEESDAYSVLDTSGPALLSGAEAKPSLLKMNIFEAEALGISSEDWLDAGRKLCIRYGLSLVLITGGEKGAVLSSSLEAWHAVPPPVFVASAVGSGDSLAAGFTWGLHHGYNYQDALALGVAAGTANAMSYGAACFSRNQVFDTLQGVAVRKLP